MTETRRYSWLRIGTGVGLSAIILLFVWLLARAVPNISQTLWPATIGCGCGSAVTFIVPPATLIASILVFATAGLFTARYVYFFIRHYLKVQAARRKFMRDGYYIKLDQKLKRNIIVVKSAESVAMTIGLFQPMIYVTTGLIKSLNKKELTAVLHHEQAHRQNFDPLWAAIIETLNLTLWRSAVTKALSAAFVTLRELTADAIATKEYQQADGLSGALVKLSGATSFSEAVSFSPNNDRVEKLLDQSWHPALGLWRWSYTWVIGLALLFVGLAIKFTPPANASIPPAVSALCHETKLLCALGEPIKPMPLMLSCPFGPGHNCQLRLSKPQSGYDF